MLCRPGVRSGDGGAPTLPSALQDRSPAVSGQQEPGTEGRVPPQPLKGRFGTFWVGTAVPCEMRAVLGHKLGKDEGSGLLPAAPASLPRLTPSS